MPKTDRRKPQLKSKEATPTRAKRKAAPKSVQLPAATPDLPKGNTKPVEASEIKQRLGIFHRNGKPKKPKMARVSLFTKEPYGFRDTMLPAADLKAAHLTPAKDDNGNIYVVVKETSEDGREKLLPWPGGISYPVVSSEKLGEALNWPEIRVIDKTQKAGWAKQMSTAVWLIVGATLILIFFLAYFFLMGSK